MKAFLGDVAAILLRLGGERGRCVVGEDLGEEGTERTKRN